MYSLSRILRAASVTAALSLAPAALAAQATAPAAAGADSLAFPRQFVKWVFSAQGDSAWAHAGPELRTSMKSAQDVSTMAARLQERFGAKQGSDTETQFAEGALKVYIVAMNFAQAPEQAAWVVAYSPSTGIVERAAFMPLSAARQRYPNAKLP